MGRPGVSLRPNTLATDCGTSAGLASGASSMSHTPSGKADASSRLAATCSDRRVLPAPPAPVSVTSRACESGCLTSAISFSRPMKLVN